MQSRLRRCWRVAAISALAFLPVAAAPIAPSADAQEVHTIRIATLAPRGSAWERGYARWNRTLSQQTNGRVRLQIYAGGSAGDERTMVRKMRTNQIDAAAVTTTGLGMIVRQVGVLSAPGVIETYPQLDAVRDELAPDLERMFEDEGFVLLGWGDAGAVRLFSKRRITTIADFRASRPWVWRDNPVFVEVLRSAGVTGVPLALPEVLSGLQTGRIDVVPSSALAAVALQWYTQVHFMSEQASGIVVGALVIRKDKLDELPPDAREALVQSARSNARRIPGSHSLVRRPGVHGSRRAGDSIRSTPSRAGLSGTPSPRARASTSRGACTRRSCSSASNG